MPHALPPQARMLCSSSSTLPRILRATGAGGRRAENRHKIDIYSSKECSCHDGVLFRLPSPLAYSISIAFFIKSILQFEKSDGHVRTFRYRDARSTPRVFFLAHIKRQSSWRSVTPKANGAGGSLRIAGALNKGHSPKRQAPILQKRQDTQ